MHPQKHIFLVACTHYDAQIQKKTVQIRTNLIPYWRINTHIAVGCMFDLLMSSVQGSAAAPPPRLCLDSRPPEPASLDRYSPYTIHKHINSLPDKPDRLNLTICWKSAGRVFESQMHWWCFISMQWRLQLRPLKQDELSVYWRTALSKLNEILAVCFHFWRQILGF